MKLKLIPQMVPLTAMSRSSLSTASRPHLKAIAVAVLLLCGPTVCLASVSSVKDLSGDQMSVRELMRLDTALALSHAKKSLRKQDNTGSAVAGSERMMHSGSLSLVAIYGVGKKLLAEVTVGTQPYVYMRGQASPVGVKADASAYLLRGISGSCVQLERKDEAHTLCLHPSLWTAK